MAEHREPARVVPSGVRPLDDPPELEEVPPTAEGPVSGQDRPSSRDALEERQLRWWIERTRVEGQRGERRNRDEAMGKPKADPEVTSAART